MAQVTVEAQAWDQRKAEKNLAPNSHRLATPAETVELRTTDDGRILCNSPSCRYCAMWRY